MFLITLADCYNTGEECAEPKIVDRRFNNPCRENYESEEECEDNHTDKSCEESQNLECPPNGPDVCGPESAVDEFDYDEDECVVISDD